MIFDTIKWKILKEFVVFGRFENSSLVNNLQLTLFGILLSMSLEQISSILVIVEVISNSGIISSLCIELDEFIFFILSLLRSPNGNISAFFVIVHFAHIHCLFSVTSGRFWFA